MIAACILLQHIVAQMCQYIGWNQWPHLIPLIWHIEQYEEIFCQPGTLTILYQMGVNVWFLVIQQVKRGKVVINGVKWGGVDVAWSLILCFLGVTQEWISSAFEMFTVFWMEILSLCWSWWAIIVGVELVVYDIWFSEDDHTGFFSVWLDILDRLYMNEHPISLSMVPMSTINTKYGK